MPSENGPAGSPPADKEPARSLADSHESASSEINPWLNQTLLPLAREAFVIGLAVTQDIDLARVITLETLSNLNLKPDRVGARPDPQKLRSQALKQSRRHSRDPVRSPIAQPPAQGVDAIVWRMLDSLEWRERLLCVLKYILGLSPAESAALFHVSTEAIQAQEAIFEKRFRAGLVQEAKSAQADPLALAAGSIRRRYISPDWSTAQLADLFEKAGSQTLAPSGSHALPIRSGWILVPVGLVAAAACLALIMFAAFYFSRVNSPPQAETAPAGTTPTSPPSSQQVSALNWLSDSDSIRLRIQQSAALWETSFMDVQIVDYGPFAYVGAPRIYRAQVWISQPAESIQLFGLHARSPSSAYMFSQGRSLYLNPVLQTSWARDESLPAGLSLTRPAALVENHTLRRMIFPREAKWSSDLGTFRMANTGSILDRSVVVVDWFNQYGQREARLWLDALLGVVLRLQEFGGPEYETLILESQATAAAFDQSFPPASLASDLRLVGASSPLIKPDPSIAIQPTPTSALTIDRRVVLASNPAPQGFDSHASALLFQFPYNLDLTNVLTGTSRIPVQIFADSYGIGTTEFGLPWMLRCARSPDGYRLAFNTGSDGASFPDDELRWLDLRQPQKVYKLLPGLHVDSFAFSPEGDQLAAFARSLLKGKNGIYTIEIATGESRLIASIAAGSSLVWSPDGETIALIGTSQAGERGQALQVHVRTGQIVFQEEMTPAGSPIPQDWPMSNWGLPFPQPEGGLDACASPP